MLCKACKEPMKRIGHINDNGKFEESYQCAKCGMWCRGHVRGESLVYVTWYKPEETKKD